MSPTGHSPTPPSRPVHPRSPALSRVRRPDRSAAELGFRLPGEFEPIDALWLTPPHNVGTWPGCLDRAAEQFQAFADAARRFTRVRTTSELHAPTHDSWARDYGPLFVVRPPPHPPGDPWGSLAAHDFIFNGWGGKYASCHLDDVIPQHIAADLSIPLWTHDLVLEGGSIDANGQGTLLTTEQCLLNPNRNPHLTRDDLERVLHDAFAIERVLWLPGGIEGDDTDGHIDDVARFVAPDAIAALRAPPDHPDHAVLERNWSALAQARGARGERFHLLPLPVPDPITYHYPPDPELFNGGGPMPVPASYANFLICNAAVLLPVFGQRHDEAAIRAVEQACPGREVVPLRAEYLIVGRGALHCLSMQQPRA